MDEKRTDIWTCTAVATAPDHFGVCGRRYTDIDLLAIHQADRHADQDDGWQCGSCTGLFDFEQDARECCRDGHPAS